MYKMITGLNYYYHISRFFCIYNIYNIHYLVMGVIILLLFGNVVFFCLHTN